MRAVLKTAFALAVIGAAMICRLIAQPHAPSGGTSRLYYPPPNSRQLKTEIFSTDATPLPGNKVLMKGFKINEYAVTGGKPEMTAEAPECIVDHAKNELSSDGALQVHAQDDRLFLEGTGFLLRQSNSSLTISNGVHSIFKSTGENGVAGPGTEISAHSGYFLMKTGTNDGSILYHGDVRLNDPKMKLTCESLSADLPRDLAGQTNPISRAVAETNVVIDFAGDNGNQSRATSQRAVYRRTELHGLTNDIIELTENPRVELTNGWMTADRLFLNRTTGKLQGRDHVHFHYLSESKDAKSNHSTQQLATEIFCDRFDYDLNTRQADFSGNARVDDERLKLTAGFLTTTLSKTATNHFDHIVAMTNVAIDFQDAASARKIHATGQKVIYDVRNTDTLSNEIATLTGNPVIQVENPVGWLAADTITVDRAQGRLIGEGNQHSVFKRQAGGPAALDTEIFSDWVESTMSTGFTIYHDHVRAYDPELNLTGKTLIVKTVHTNQLEMAQIDGGVTLDFIDKPFSSDDITNLTTLAKRLKQPEATDGVGQYTAAQLNASTRDLLTDFQGGTSPSLKAALAQNLNNLVRSNVVYDANRFAGVFPSADTSTLMNSQPLGVDLVAWNRLLLLDAFRGQIARGANGEKLHATGDHATLTHTVTEGTTNSMVELTGHPRLDRPDGWVTAEDAIIADRATGVIHFLGHPRFHTRFEGLAKTKLPGAKKKDTK